MNSLFTPQQDALITRMKNLQAQLDVLVWQRKQVKHNKVLRDSFTITISHVLDAITRLSDEIEKEKPTDGNQ